MRYAVGIDPDLHDTAIAITSDARVVDIRIARVPKGVKGREAQEMMIREIIQIALTWNLLRSLRESLALSVVVSEGQQIYAGGKTKNWDSILVLGAITGAAAACCSGYPNTPVLIPKPKEWKGDVPKRIHQARVLRKRGYEFDVLGGKTSQYCRPRKAEEFDLKKSDWRHAVDAIGLADWGLKQIE